MTPPLRIAVAGLGTVGAGTLALLARHDALLAMRCGRRLEVTAVCARDRDRDRGVSLDGIAWHDTVESLAHADGDVVVELIGGASGAALDLARAALAAGKHLVTANKALIAHHGPELARIAEGAGLNLAYEAAVAGGIPIVKGLREGLAGNRIDSIHGILNGTCNYVLTTMRETGRDFDDVLGEAQALGYAEADPSFDVDGIDSAHKLAILSSVAFGADIDFGAVYVEGIRGIAPLDLVFAEELGYRIKLLGLARAEAGGIAQRVHPCMVPKAAPIAQVEGVLNAVVADGDFVGGTVYEGPGAGAGPTASAVVADLIDIARGGRVPTFSIPAAEMRALAPVPIENRIGPYYVRLMVVDRPGVIADITACLRDHQVSMETMIQRARKPGEAVPVVMTVHDVKEAAMGAAIDQIGRLPTVLESPHMIRIEAL
ncbi:MAG: homoserine dehydrogenase [Alphaproteobacteria bacterium]|nr:homoserine dehydrogenase [Alphaproteobacteria bacterium]MDP6516866.1 homoserine dehydrogenase [Alphaproteobacteria bacterium]